MKKLSEVVKLVDLPRQRIQEYEKAGIAFKPKKKNNHGDWLYGEAEIERLWQIKFYLTLKLKVPEIKAIFADPNYNKHDAIADQIIKLENQKKDLESMIEIARAYNEMDVLPSDFRNPYGSILEDIPYEAAAPLIGRILSLCLQKNEEFRKSIMVDFASEDDEKLWLEIVKNISKFYMKGVSYESDMVQQEIDNLRSIDKRLFPDSLIKQFCHCRVLFDFVAEVKEALGNECFKYVRDAIDYYDLFYKPKWFEKHPSALSELPIMKVLFNMEQLARNSFTTGSAEVQSEVASLHKLLDDFGGFSKETQLELLSSISSSIGCKSTREVFDGGRDRGIYWFISRAIEIYAVR